MQDCLFCKIVRKEIPNHTVFEDDDILAFLDIHPCAKGHTIVIPKQHFNSLFDMDEEWTRRVALGVREAVKRVQEKLQPSGMNVGINNGEAAGQAVPHVHWHIIPRYKGDGGGSMHSIVRGKDTGDVKEVAKLFQ